MALESFPVIVSIGFHVNKLAPEKDTLESENHGLFPFLYQDKDLPTGSPVSATTTTIEINSTNNANINNSTVNDNTNGILILSSTTTTAAKQ